MPLWPSAAGFLPSKVGAHLLKFMSGFQPRGSGQNDTAAYQPLKGPWGYREKLSCTLGLQKYFLKPLSSFMFVHGVDL